MTLAVEVSGGGDGWPWVVLLHGGGCTLRSWDGVRARLAPGVRVCAVDLPGHGRSDEVGDGSFEAIGAEVAGALGEAGVVDPVLVGWSLGWPIALACAPLLPSVRALVSVDGPVAPYAEEVAPFYPSIGAFVADVRSRNEDRTAADLADLQRQIDQDPLAAAGCGDELRRRWQERPDGTFVCRPTAAASIELAVRNVDFDVPAHWAAVRAPVRYLLATQQPPAVVALHRSAARDREATHGRTRTIEVDGSHALPFDRPDAVADVVNQLVAG